MKGKEIFKRSKGITLIALVITIIVLLILAGVTIATLTGDNGLLSKASGARDTSTEAEILEKLKLAYQDYYLGQHTTSGYTFQNAVDKMFGTGAATVTEANGIYTVAFTNGKAYTFNSLTGTVREKDTSLGGQITKDNYGDYIDLGQSVVGDANSTSDDWRILYNDKNGHVYAILADYLPNSNSAIINSGLLTSEIYNVYASTTSEDFLNRLNHPTVWKSLIPEGLRSSCNVTGAATVEIIQASYNEKYGTSYDNHDIACYIDNDSSKGIDTLYMPHPDNVIDNCFGYWLASIDEYSDAVYQVAINGLIGYRDDYNSEWTYTGVCPVVSIPSNLQATNITSGNTTTWLLSQ